MGVPDRSQTSRLNHVDWDVVDTEIRAGRMSLRTIATEAGVTDGCIRKRMKRLGLQRDLTERVREATRIAEVRDLAASTQSGTHVPEMTDDQLVDAVATQQVALKARHRKSCGESWRRLERIEAAAALMPLGTSDEVDNAVTVEMKIQATKSKLIATERRAYGLDDRNVQTAPAQGDIPPDQVPRIEQVRQLVLMMLSGSQAPMIEGNQK